MIIKEKVIDTHLHIEAWENEEYSSGNGVLHKIPFKETRGYVEKVNKSREIYQRLYPELDN